MTLVRLVVYGIPGPQGSKSFKGLAKSGKAILVESSAKVKPWRAQVYAAAVTYRNGRQWLNQPLDAPLVARMVFTLPKPSNAPTRRRTWPMRTPDLDKLARSTCDALTTAGIWADDARLVEFDRLAKVYPGEDPDALEAPGVRILIWSALEPRPAGV